MNSRHDLNRYRGQTTHVMNRKSRQSKQEKKKKAVHSPERESDENFAFIIGYTLGGFPYGITHEEMEDLNEKE